MALTKNPKLALIPSGYKASKVYSVLPSNGVGDFDFTRSGNATRVNKDGLIETVDADVPRLNYPMIDGVVSGCPSLLLEPSRSNLVTYSEDFNNSSWLNSYASISENTTISPDGTQNAETFLITSNNGVFYKAPSLSSGTTVTQSIFVKNIDADRINLEVSTVSTAGLVSFFFTNSEITSFELTNGISADFDNYGNGWYRIYLTCTTNETNQLFKFRLNESGMSCYVWGAMLEEGSFPSSYIPTTTSTATRSAETCTGAGDANTFNDSEGVLFGEISALAKTGRIALNDGTTSNNVRFVYNSSTNVIEAILFNGTNQASLAYSLPIKGAFNKISFKYKASDFSLYVDGFKVDSQVGSGTTFTSGTLSEIDFDAGSNGLVPFYGSVKQLQYFDTALSDEELALLTSL